MTDFKGRHILLGVTGSIAAFKSAALASDLTKAGAAVRVVLTADAERFVGAETFAGITHQPVSTSLWGVSGEDRLDHIGLAKWADVVVVAPASAHTIARMALGLADDLLTTILLATPSPILIAPAMESHMFQHGATQAHLDTLRSRGVVIIGPAEGHLASGAEGVGRMVEPHEIVAQLRDVNALAASSKAVVATATPDARRESLETRDESTSRDEAASVRGQAAGGLLGVRVVITAGPTREPIDPVRFISNRSSGKMGYELARAAQERGADVLLISGPVDEALAERLDGSVRRIDVETAEEMRRAMAEAAPGAAVIIMAAAVSDFRPAEVSTSKIKNSKTMSGIALEPTIDILTNLKEMAPHARRIGFAAETDDVIENATKKLRQKCLDMIVANDVGDVDNPVFGAETNRGTIIRPDRDPEQLPIHTKESLARRIMEDIEEMVAESRKLEVGGPRETTQLRRGDAGRGDRHGWRGAPAPSASVRPKRSARQMDRAVRPPAYRK